MFMWTCVKKFCWENHISGVFLLSNFLFPWPQPLGFLKIFLQLSVTHFISFWDSEGWPKSYCWWVSTTCECPPVCNVAEGILAVCERLDKKRLPLEPLLKYSDSACPMLISDLCSWFLDIGFDVNLRFLCFQRPVGSYTDRITVLSSVGGNPWGIEIGRMQVSPHPDFLIIIPFASGQLQVEKWFQKN